MTGDERLYWHIVGYDSTNEITRIGPIPQGNIGPNELLRLLQTLVAKYSLEDEEIADCFKARGRGRRDLLTVHRDGRHGTVSCGDNPHFHAKLEPLKKE